MTPEWMAGHNEIWISPKDAHEFAATILEAAAKAERGAGDEA